MISLNFVSCLLSLLSTHTRTRTKTHRNTHIHIYKHKYTQTHTDTYTKHTHTTFTQRNGRGVWPKAKSSIYCRFAKKFGKQIWLITEPCVITPTEIFAFVTESLLQTNKKRIIYNNKSNSTARSCDSRQICGGHPLLTCVFLL